MNGEQTTNGLRWHAKSRYGSGQSVRAESRDESEKGRWLESIRDRLQQSGAVAAAVITTNSILTFFTPLADQLLRADRGVLGKEVV